jgi:hypothetical protein
LKTSESSTAVYAALITAQGLFEAAIKDQANPAFRHNYADLTSHVEAARPHLAANKLGVLQDVVATPEGVSITTRLIHASGEWVEFGPLDIPAFKYDAQGLGSAITYGRRYALSAALCTIADDDDANAAVATAPDRRPARVEAPPATVVDTKTGEEVAVAAAGLPEAPVGYHYVTGYKKTGVWHEASLLAYDAQGGALRVSTKNKLGEGLKTAQDAGVPVKVTTSPKANSVGEAYLDSVTLWKPKPGPKPVAPPPAAPDTMLRDDEIPF